MGWATPGLRCRDSWSISWRDGMGWDGMGWGHPDQRCWKFGTIRSSHSEIEEMAKALLQCFILSGAAAQRLA
jgi:hypothetical protein